jgi:hypothetical protein
MNITSIAKVSKKKLKISALDLLLVFPKYCP